MQLTLSIRYKCEGEGGHVLIHKVAPDGLKHIGEVLFRDDGEKKWIIAVLMERHPHVTLSQDGVPCDASMLTGNTPC
jgi:hypothetical protein